MLENILGAPTAPPPPIVPALEDTLSKAGDHKPTQREALAIHRADPMCASCHMRMDPLGFGCENFDAIGRWREREAGAPIDASGSTPGGKTFTGPVELKALLVANKEAFARTLSQRMLTFALGRSLQDHDDDTLDRLAQALARDQYRFSTLVTGIVTSFPFLNRRSGH
jgi:hypothetical protein